MPVIQMKVVSSDINTIRLMADKVKRAARDELSRQGARYLKLYEATTANWKGRKPPWTVTTNIGADQMSVSVTTDDKIYRFLHDGTKERWAVMSSDWSSQTTPRLLGSAPGRGIAAFRGKAIMRARGYQRPMPGIKAREWTQEIIDRDGTKFKDAIEKAIAQAISRDMLSLH